MSIPQNGALLRTANACLMQLRFRRRSNDTSLTGRVYELVKSGAIDAATLQRMSAAVHRKTPIKSVEPIPPPEAGEFGENSRRVGLVGIKLGMMPQWEAKTGKRVLCTLIHVPDNQIVQVLDPETWYRDSIVGKRKAYGRYGPHHRVTVGAQNIDPVFLDPKWQVYFKKHGVPAKEHIGSFLVSSDAVLPEGFRLDARHFNVGQFVNVSGRTIDWGFQGGMHRWGMRGLPDRRTTKAHRRIGSIGSCGDARVWPGKRMPGHMGYEWRQVSGLEVVRINPLESVIYVKGSVPGDAQEKLLINDCLHEDKRVKNPPFPTYLETIPEEDEEAESKQVVNAANLTSADIYHEKIFRFDSPSIVFTAADEKQSAARDKMRAKIAKVKK
uniref:Large ribosomal subunit protein uL3m n=2 Tax=Panagrellus redivivus TaxID=6233 RepID=A0A7E4ZXP4_PANRE